MFGPSKKELEMRILAMTLYCERLNARLLAVEKQSARIVPQMKPFIRSAS